jgi:Uma2 family endonuclease
LEVLSPITSATDFNRKLPDYQQIPSMRDVLLVSSMERLVRHWRRGPGAGRSMGTGARPRSA